MPSVSLEEMLKSGVHFGHKLGRLYPKMKPFIFGERNGISIIDLEKTKEKIEAAQEYIKGIAQKNGTLLMIGTKRQAQEIVKKYAVSIKMPYIIGRWIGGAFTNFSVISKMIAKFTKLKQEREQGELNKYTKKEQLKIDEEITKLDSLIGGIENLKKLPDAVYIVDVKNEMTAVREAKKKKIPIIAIVDVNNSPEGIDYVIPANDDATKAIEYITRVLTESFEEGMAEKKEEAEIKEEIKK
ncbi:MAG: 30S ribosomal protein S2 [Patescibacteria group bacterium]